MTELPQLDTPEWFEKTVHIDSLIPYERNPRIITKDAYDRLKASVQKLGYHQRMICQPENGDMQYPVIGGHQRLRVMKELGREEIKILYPSRELTREEFRQLLIQDNLPFGQHDFDMLAADFDVDELKAWGMPEQWLEGRIEDEKAKNAEPTVSLAERFGIPPFSILNSREGWWQGRKQAWLAKGIKSELGRDAPAGGSPDMAARQAGESGTSVFDPVLCEIAYRWFCPPEGIILDPFAGGSVRGIVAASLGLQYRGVELRAEQVNANFANADEIGLNTKAKSYPYWICADSQQIPELLELKPPSFEGADFLFSCPPYADLEVYSDDPRDLSTMRYEHFRVAYRAIIKAAVDKLKPDRFACFVVGEVRDRDGLNLNFVGDTTRAFIDAGMDFYNEAILVTPTGSAATRAGNSFTKSRKMAKVHQNVLVFVKGDPKKATAAIGDVEFGEMGVTEG